MSRIRDFFLGEIAKSHDTAAARTSEALGQSGSIIIDDTAAHTGPFIAITVIGTADAVIDTSECDLGTLEDQPATITIPKGGTIFGNFTSIELDSGVIIAYRQS
jgi:hypothetical protein|tara:strand:+ start:8636 stop:8947 length:312 start_codon:yes stop_codon:yes gene_type:complete